MALSRMNLFRNTPILWNYTRYMTVAQPTIDHKEVDFFKKQASIWWDDLGDFKPLHALNQMRIPLIRDGLINSGTVLRENIGTHQPLKGLCLLDVGCGGGILSEPLSRLGGKVTGIDATPELIAIAKDHQSSQKDLENLEYLWTSIEDHSAENKEKYDALIASEVIEHVQDKSTFLKHCVACLKPGGSIFITTLSKTFWANLVTVTLAENLGYIPKGTHELEKFITPVEMQRMLEENNCTTKVVHGMLYNILNNKFYWISDKSVHYALHAVKNKSPP